MEKRGITQELPDIEKESSFSYPEDLMDKYSQKMVAELKNKEKQRVKKDISSVEVSKAK